MEWLLDPKLRHSQLGKVFVEVQSEGLLEVAAVDMEGGEDNTESAEEAQQVQFM